MNAPPFCSNGSAFELMQYQFDMSGTGCTLALDDFDATVEADADALLVERIQNGEYGACESCGEPITYSRLMARPVATLCIDCKTEAEQVERRKRVF